LKPRSFSPCWKWTSIMRSSRTRIPPCIPCRLPYMLTWFPKNTLFRTIEFSCVLCCGAVCDWRTVALSFRWIDSFLILTLLLSALIVGFFKSPVIRLGFGRAGRAKYVLAGVLGVLARWACWSATRGRAGACWPGVLAGGAGRAGRGCWACWSLR
jgi:hypothetical protein